VGLDRLVLEHSRLRAMQEVIDQSDGFLWRQIQRWYSKTFSTPLSEVEALETECLLQHYFESKYADLPFAERVLELGDILETSEEARVRQLREDEELVEELRFRKIAEAEAKKKEAANKPKELKVLPKLGPDRPLKATLPEPTMEGFGADRKVAHGKELSALPEGVEFVFVSDEELEREAEGLGMMAPPPKNRK
jgi:hypothetical protein